MDNDFNILYYREGIDRPLNGPFSKLNKHRAHREAGISSRATQAKDHEAGPSKEANYQASVIRHEEEKRECEAKSGNTDVKM